MRPTWMVRQEEIEQSQPMLVGLIACSKSKREHPAPARELYTGALFAKSLRYAEEHCAQSWVLSAKHRLISLDTVIEPYDEALHTMSKREVEVWAHRVWLDIFARYKGQRIHFVFLAGALYRLNLIEDLARYSPMWTWHTPHEGMGIGEQLHALTPRKHEQQTLGL